MIAFIKGIFKIILLKPLYNILMFFVWLVPGNNLGIAVVILTFLIRLSLLPSSAKSMESQTKLKELQPEMAAIKEKYKGNKEGEAKATMALYQKYNINPLGSCLPLLLQFPILIIFYYTIKIGMDTNRFDLLYSFTPHPHIINTTFLLMDLTKPCIYLAIIAGIFQFIQARQMMPKTDKSLVKKDDSGAMMQNMMGNQMMYFMPLLTVYIGATLPAAVTLYWLITTLFTIGQQYWITKHRNPKSIKVTIKENNG